VAPKILRSPKRRNRSKMVGFKCDEATGALCKRSIHFPGTALRKNPKGSLERKGDLTAVKKRIRATRPIEGRGLILFGIRRSAVERKINRGSGEDVYAIS